MAIYAKKYNEKLKKWEVVSPTSDSDIVVLNNNYTDSGNPVTLNSTLSKISSDIEKLQRNVSWLAEHGGGGGGGNGGTQGSNYAITILNPGVTDNQLFVSSRTFTISFKITGGTTSDYVQYRCIYDGNALDNNYTRVRVNTTVKVEISDIEEFSNVTPHSFIIEAVDPDGMSIPSYNLAIVETSIVLGVQKDNIFKIGSESKFIVNVTNKILNSEVTIKVKNTTTNNEDTITFTSNTTATQQVNFNFFDKLVDIASVKVGNRYNLSITGQLTTHNGTRIDADEVTANVLIQGSDKIVIILSEIPTLEEFENGTEKEFSSNGNLIFGFTPFLSSNVSSVYYAVKISLGAYTKPVAGYFDLMDEDGTPVEYNKNPFTSIGSVKTIATALGDDFIGDKILVEVRCWSADGLISETVTGACRVVASTTNEFKTQIPIRGLKSTVGNSLYASFGNSQFNGVSSSDANVTVSNISAYLPVGNSEEDLVPSRVPMDIYGTNGEENGFMTEKGSSSFLRLSNDAYALVNITDNTFNQWVSNDGFTISVTFKSDFHPYNDRTIFFMGMNDGNKVFKSGMKVDLEKVYWYFTANGTQQKMEVNIKQNTMTTVDFVYVHKTELIGGQNVDVGMAKIYVNGIINAAKEANAYQTSMPNKIYLGANVSSDGTPWNNADVNIYGLRIFNKYLNDIQVVVNSHNDRAERDENNSIDPVAYDIWKKKNYLLDPEEGSTVARSELYKLVDNEYKYLENVGYAALKANTPLPIVYMDGTASNFNKDLFFSTNLTTEQTKQVYDNFELYYYDPDVNKEIHADTIGVSIQGTSTTTLRSKNLELYFKKQLENGNLEMFQPKASWFPESEFTLKADVVDSAHANNATIGKWINEYASKTILEDNPAMIAARENKPHDVDENGKDYGVQSIVPEVKHTLEGFPVIVLVRFSGESSPTFLGIYSFNLGRYSYFNMGLNFLKSYSRRKKNAQGEYDDEIAPALVDAYVPYNRNETIKYNNGQNEIRLSDVHSFEFGSDADDNTLEHATWSQDNLTVIEHIGEFKYYGGADDHSSQPPSGSDPWLKLQALFAQTARIPEPTTSKIYTYDSATKQYTTNGETYAETNEVETFVDKLSIKNAYGYFVICMAFGMVDSLGKNLTLRTWGDGKWYPCFYDMDTALGLTNAGEESVPSTAYIDSFDNSTRTDVPNVMVVRRNTQQTHGFGAYNSKLWNILRETSDERGNKSFWATRCESVWNDGFYGDFWRMLRDGSLNDKGETIGPLSSSDNFLSVFTSQTKDVGEMVYNDDFNVKYLTKYLTAGENGTYRYGNIEMLHGTRTEYIRSWLKDRFIFLDGVLNVSSAVIDHYPYYTRGYITCGGPEGGGYPTFTISTTSPTIFTAEIGQNGEVNKWFVPAYTDTKIILPQLSSDSKRIGINSTTIITKIDGLKNNRFEKFESIELPSFSQIDLSLVKTLSKDTPVDFAKTFINTINNERVSDVRKIDLSYTSGATNFPVILSETSAGSERFNYWKVNSIDVSNSCVSSLKLSSSPLSTLKVNNSDITNLVIESQPYLTDEDFNFTQCDSLEKLYIKNCKGLKDNLVVSSMNILNTLEVSNCAEIKSIEATGNTHLTQVTVSSCPELTILNLDYCTNEDLQISIIDCPKLTKLVLTNLKTSKPIIMPTKDKVTKIESIDMTNSINLDAFRFGETADVLQYNGDNVLDLSSFSSLTSSGLKVNDMNSLKYIKFANDINKPFQLGRGFFSGCGSLKRVFGNVKLMGSNIFYKCTSFFIHDLPEGDSVPLPTVRQFDTSDDGFVTNIQVGVSSFANMFAYTNCNLYDVYYMLQKCDSSGNGNNMDVTNISSMFAFCKNIQTDTENNSLNADAFSHCGKVTNMGGLFYACGLKTRIPSPILDSHGNTTKNGLFQYLYKVSLLSNAFDGCTVYMDDKAFSKTAKGENLAVSNISYFNPQFVKDGNSAEMEDAFACAGNLFKYMPSLNTIDHSFCGSRIYFSHVDTGLSIKGTPIYSSDIFYNNTRVTNINASFNNLTACGYIRNIFGGYPSTVDSTEHFPSKLTGLTSSFNVLKVDSDESVPIDEQKILNIYIGDSFLNKISGSIVYMGTSSKDNTSSMNANFGGQFKKYVDPVDVDEHAMFPYKVFVNCKKLKEAPGFFANIQRTSGSTGENLTLPYYMDNGESVSMFANATELTNLSYAFYNIDIPTTLKGFGFTNTKKLTNVEGLFANVHLQGQIPYGLFAQEQTKSYAQMKGLLYSNAIKRGITNGNYGVTNLSINPSTGKVNVVFDTDGRITTSKSEPFLSGTTIIYMDDYGELCQATVDGNVTTWYDSRDTNHEHPHVGSVDDVKSPVRSNDKDIDVFNGSYKTYNDTITNMSSVFSGITTEKMEAYKLDINPDDINRTTLLTGAYGVVEDNPLYCPIFLTPNDNFDPVLFIHNSIDGTTSINPNYDPRRVKENVSYNAYAKIWNKWINDGTPTLYNAIINSPLYADDDISIDKELPSDIVSTSPTSITSLSPMNDLFNKENERQTERSYFIPGDLFRYCKSTAIIHSAFRGSGGADYDADNGLGWPNTLKKGFYGAIPPYLFENVRNTKSLKYMFCGLKGITPYNWAQKESILGNMYPPQLLRNMHSLTDVSHMFDGCYVYPYTKIPDEFFTTNVRIQDASYLFNNCKFADNVNEQVPSALFARCSGIQNVSYMFARGDYSSVRAPYKMDKNLFTPEKNPSINDIRCFMYMADNTSGSVPEFWNTGFANMRNVTKAYKGLTSTKITNYNSIPVSYKN